MGIENVISIRDMIVRLITPSDPQILMSRLSTLGYGMTRIEGSGSFTATVNIIIMIVPGGEKPGCSLSSPGNTRTSSTPSRTFRNIKDGARIFYKDPKRRIFSLFGM